MPGRPLKICAMPTASDTAPPVRPGDALADRGLELPAGCTTGMPELARTPAGDVLMAK